MYNIQKNQLQSSKTHYKRVQNVSNIFAFSHFFLHFSDKSETSNHFLISESVILHRKRHCTEGEVRNSLGISPSSNQLRQLADTVSI